MLEQKAKEAAADVMICTRRLVSAVEAREKNLLNMIEKARVLKFASLKAKDESLRNDKARLIRATDRLCAAIGLCSSICNPKDLLANKDMALAEVLTIIFFLHAHTINIFYFALYTYTFQPTRSFFDV